MLPHPEEQREPLVAAEDEIHQEAVELVAIAAAIIAIGLIILVPFATTAAPEGRGWFLSPRNLPLLGLSMMLCGAALLSLDFLRKRKHATDGAAYWNRALSAFDGLGDALKYVVLFCLYVVVLSYAGFALSTLVFGQTCLWLAGLRGVRWSLWNLAFTVILVVVLRVLMGLWFPQAPILEFAPAWFANSIGPYL